jgi:hypothetical protein
MRTKCLILLIGLFWISTSVPASADSRSYVLWGVGNDSCGKFLQEQAQRSQRFELQLSWIAGFVSAGNGELTSMMAKKNIESDLLKGTDPATLETWLGKYCNKNSLKNLSSAAYALEQSLLERVSGSRINSTTKPKQLRKNSTRHHNDFDPTTYPISAPR